MKIVNHLKKSSYNKVRLPNVSLVKQCLSFHKKSSLKILYIHILTVQIVNKLSTRDDLRPVKSANKRE